MRDISSMYARYFNKGDPNAIIIEHDLGEGVKEPGVPMNKYLGSSKILTCGKVYYFGSLERILRKNQQLQTLEILPE